MGIAEVQRHFTAYESGEIPEFELRNCLRNAIAEEPELCSAFVALIEAHRRANLIDLDLQSTLNADIEEVTGSAVNFPVIGDTELKIAKLYDMLPGDAGDSCEGRTPADNATVRMVFVVGPDKRIKLTLAYPMTTGRNFDEIIRVLDSMQLTAKHKVATPANWKQGEDVIITGAVSNDDAAEIFPGYKTVKPYLRTTAQPK